MIITDPDQQEQQQARKRTHHECADDTQIVDDREQTRDRTPPECVVKCLCKEAAEARLHAFNKKTES
jgi:hypothetical protein